MFARLARLAAVLVLVTSPAVAKDWHGAASVFVTNGRVFATPMVLNHAGTKWHSVGPTMTISDVRGHYFWSGDHRYQSLWHQMQDARAIAKRLGH